MKVVRIQKVKKVKENRGIPTRCLVCKKKDIDFSRYAFYSRKDSIFKIRKLTESESIEPSINENSLFIKESIKRSQELMGELTCYVMRFGFCNCGNIILDLYKKHLQKS